jgi:hypothetical protein
MIIAHKPRIIGTIEYMHGRNGQILRRGRSHNGITTAGFNYMLDCMFGAAVPVSQLDPWYIGLINNTPSPTLLATDTLVSHSGWVELVPGTAYTGNRQTWADADAALSAKSSSSVATFPIIATVSAYGMLLCSEDAQGDDDADDILWATGAFDAVLDLINGDDLKVSYGLSMS